MTELLNQKRLPWATYRLQLNENFNLKDVLDKVDFFNQLGISDCYLSPIFTTAPGSEHGYNVTDYTKVNPKLGNEESLATLAARLKQLNMGLILDIVPNHMSIADASNKWWYDVLENGPSSEFAHYFDIHWKTSKVVLANKLLLPVLGQQYGKVLEDQEIRIEYKEGIFCAFYWDKKLPIAHRTWPIILISLLEKMILQLGERSSISMELESIISALSHLPSLTEKNPQKLKEAQREKEVIKRRLKALYNASEEIREGLNLSLIELNGTKSDPKSFDRLDELMSHQAYRLCFWRVAAEEINYRRFFDVNDLAAIRVEEPEVFCAVHELLYLFIQQGWITGVRVDHVDGLYEPEQYLKDLQDGCRHALQASSNAALKQASEDSMYLHDRNALPFYVIVEKILSQKEELLQWPIQGTTGYEFLNLLNEIFLDANNKQPIYDLYEEFMGISYRMKDLVYTCKKVIMLSNMSSEIYALTFLLDKISEQNRWTQDFTLGNLRHALREVIACFSVYRSYVREGDSEVVGESRKHILLAIAEAKRRNRSTNSSVFDFIQSVLLLEDPSGLQSTQIKERRTFVMRFQQLTGTIMAKGVEDTAYYRMFPLLSKNEVGNDWSQFGITLDIFHKENQKRLARWPDTLLATSTHDTKRSEDARARLNTISEIPQEWKTAIFRWKELNASRKRVVDEVGLPSFNEEYFLYQELVGSWPLEEMDEVQLAAYSVRIQEHMLKALREAKVHTSWVNPNEEYENAVNEFIKSILKLDNKEFLNEFAQFLKPIKRAGIWNSLSQLLIKMTVPGIPDFYQGSEIFSFNLVDPDNRRLIDYQLRACLLKKLHMEEGSNSIQQIQTMKETLNNGALKLYLMVKVLKFRGSHQDLFARGRYIPLKAGGEKEEHLIAYARCNAETCLVVITSRFFLKLKEIESPVDHVWKGSFIELPQEFAEGNYQDLLTGRQVEVKNVVNKHIIEVKDAFAHLPFAVLEMEL